MVEIPGSVGVTMSDRWDEFDRRVRQWHREGDADRLNLTTLYYRGFECHEIDPAQTFALYTQARDEARRLEEPWWVLFFESWRLNALTSNAMDFARAMPLAMELMVLFNSPEGRVHPDRQMVLDNVLYTYIKTDPHGYEDDIERGARYLDELIEKGAVGMRFVLNHRRMVYLSFMERWDEAYELALRSLGLIDQVTDSHSRIWHSAWTLYQLCRVCYTLERFDELSEYTEHLREISTKHGQLRRTQADSWFWHAMLLRLQGDPKSAVRAYQRGLTALGPVERRDSICADPMAAYHEACENWQGALEIRDHELADVSPKGMYHRACEIHLDRCRILQRIGTLTDQDLTLAREAANLLRKPKWYLKKLEKFQPM